MRRWTTALFAMLLLGACGPREEQADMPETTGDETVEDTGMGAGGHEPYASEGADPAPGAMPTTGEE